MKKFLTVLLAGMIAVGSSTIVFAAAQDEPVAESNQLFVAQEIEATNSVQNEVVETFESSNPIPTENSVIANDDYDDYDGYDEDDDDWWYDSVIDIEVISGPAKPINIDDIFDLFDSQYVSSELLSGMKLKFTFESGETQILTCGVDDDEINSLLFFEFEDEIGIGVNPLTISSDNKSITYNVEITDNSGIESITVKKMPDKTEYTFYEDINLSGLELEIVYSDGRSTVYEYSDDNMYWNYFSELFDGHYLKLYLDIDEENHTYIINVMYAGAKTEFSLEVTKYITNVELIKVPDKVFTEEFDVEDLFNSLETEDDWDNFQKIREKNSISYNMAGAQVKFSFNDSEPIVYTFNENDRLSDVEGGLNTCMYTSFILGDGTINEYFLISDLGNFRADIEYHGFFKSESIEFTANYALVEPFQTVLTDPQTGISVTGDIDNGAELVVTTAKTTLDNVVAAYDITLVKDGKTIQPNGTITVSIPCEQNKLTVYQIKPDGTTDKMKASYENGKYVFYTDYLSTFALVDDANADKGATDASESASSTDSSGTSNTENGFIATGADSSLTAVILTIVFGMGMIIVYMKRRENS